MSGPHDFAVRRINALVRSAARVHRIPPHVRDDRETPPLLGRDDLALLLFLPGRQAGFLKIRNGGFPFGTPSSKVVRKPFATAPYTGRRGTIAIGLKV